MTPSTNKTGILVALALPLVLIVGSIAFSQYNLERGTLWYFSLKGYDPRDLLKGHYIHYVVGYDWDGGARSCDDLADCCLCLTETWERKPPRVHFDRCEATRRCDASIRDEQLEKLQRFYIPGAHASELERIFIKAARTDEALLQVSVTSEGSVTVKDLLVYDQPLNEALLK
ncbi:MAG: GDYXXLXY domain-containing protein [Myxococcales bacterium]|nr:MAG: GDYXXLXY domain-containing protein [Myxococcales bacterium]